MCSFCSCPPRLTVRTVSVEPNGRIEARVSVATSSFMVSCRSPGASEQDPAVAAGDERGDVGKHTRERQAARTYEVARTPGGVELLLVGSQAVKVVERFAVTVDESAQSRPEIGASDSFDTRQRCHTEVEPAVALVTSPQHHEAEQRVHYSRRRVGAVSHQVWRKLNASWPRPERRERFDDAVALDDRRRKPGDVLTVEGAEGKPLLGGSLVGEPVVRDVRELVQPRRDLLRLNHGEAIAFPFEAVHRRAN